jgi:hypothetical protein
MDESHQPSESESMQAAVTNLRPQSNQKLMADG